MHNFYLFIFALFLTESLFAINPPTNFKVFNCDDKVVLTWVNPSFYSHIQIYEETGINSDSYNVIQTCSTGITRYELTKVNKHQGLRYFL